jgi:multiple sugar transport system permease protein
MTTLSAERQAAPTTTFRTDKKDWKGWGFIAPFAVVFLAMTVAPILYAIYLSLFRDQLVGGNAFVGVANYVSVLTDGKFWTGFLHVLVFLVIQVPIMLALSLVAALALDSLRLYGAGLFRIMLFLPYAVPGVVAALIWGFMYGNQFGLTANINQMLGGDILQPLSLHWILASIGNIVTWEFMGYNMLIFYSALKVIPTDLYEAAEIDGANAMRTIWSIKIPGIRGALVIAAMFSIIGSFQLFNEPQLLQQLSPNSVTTYFTPNMYAYNLSFAGQQFNMAAAVAIVMGVITAVIAYVVQLRGTREENR